MATYTPNYNLSKPEANDDFDAFRASYGDNMDKIDNNMGGGGGGGGHTIVDPTGADMPQENKLQFTGAVSVSDDAVNGQTVVDIEGGGNYYLNTIYSTEEKKVGYWTDGKPLYQKTLVLNNLSVTNNQWAKTNESATGIETIADGFLIDNQSPSQTFQCDIGVDGGKIAVLTWFVGNSSRTMSYLTFRYTKTTDTPETNPQTGGVIYLPTIYSDEEREVGVWRDGKPLYQKTILVTSIVSGNNTINHGISNVDKIVNAVGTFFSNANDSSLIPNGNLQTAWSVSMFNFGTTTFTISVGSSWVQYFDYIQVTIQYTKTTDVAGSGTWTPSGAKAVHYSTNEQVIGTWIDGKPLYEKTFNFTGTYSGDQGSVPINMSIADTIFPVEAWGINSGNAICPFPYVHSSANNNGGFFISVDKNSIGLRFASGLTFKKVVITLRYTKTTD